MDERDEKGQFKKGHEGIGGRPAKAREQAILHIAREVVGQNEWRDIFTKALDDALKDEDGRTRDKARRFLAEYLIGKPAQTVKITGDDDAVDEYGDLSDDELRVIAGQLEGDGGDGRAGAG